jgi:magnesium transporter
MLAAYRLTNNGPEPFATLPTTAGGGAGWIDLFNPTAEEDTAAETLLGVSIPTREEALEIESTSRFFVEDGATFLNLAVLIGVDAGEPILSPLSFVLKGDWVTTVRYTESAAFKQFQARSVKPKSNCNSATGIISSLTESIIDRAADIVEKIGADIDRINNDIFKGRSGEARGGRTRERRLEEFLEKIAYQNDIISKSRESLMSIERMLQYLSGSEVGWPDRKGDRDRLRLMARDVRSLTDQLSFLSSKATFLLDATLGLISVEQNDVIRVLTVAATILLPPTLIGTIYGMNFSGMPELKWSFGYPLAIILMVAAAVVPYLILKRRGWF